MTCPKCKAQMEKVNYQSITIDRCTDCKGLWFDMLEEEALNKLAGSEVVDSGDSEIGKKYNRVDRISCPKCDTQMIRMVDSKQPHIWYESCSACYGVYFDAGEFKDFKEIKVLDSIKKLLSRERK